MNETNYLYKKISNSLGSNDGGLYEGTDGIKRYIKFYKNPLQSICEFVANKLYSELDISVPKSILINEKNYAGRAYY